MSKDWWKESGHVAEKHEACERPHCHICEGGLTCCTLCSLYEGSLTTHCAGQKVYAIHSDAVYGGREDFYNGTWVLGRRTVFMYPEDYTGD